VEARRLRAHRRMRHILDLVTRAGRNHIGATMKTTETESMRKNR